MALKGNQGVQDAFALAAADGYADLAHDWAESVEKGPGRNETRRVTTLSEPE